MIKDYKKIPLKEVPIGTEFGTLITPNGTHWASFKLINKCGAFVTLRVFDERDETYSTEDAFITVPLTVLTSPSCPRLYLLFLNLI